MNEYQHRGHRPAPQPPKPNPADATLVQNILEADIRKTIIDGAKEHLLPLLDLPKMHRESRHNEAD